MALILDTHTAPDGTDIRCRLSDGSEQVFHWPVAPSDPQAAADAAEAVWLAAQTPVSDYEIETEDGSLV